MPFSVKGCSPVTTTRLSSAKSTASGPDTLRDERAGPDGILCHHTVHIGTGIKARYDHSDEEFKVAKLSGNVCNEFVIL